MNSFFHNIDSLLRSSIPVLTVILPLLLLFIPWNEPLLHSIIAPLALISLCHWVVNRPDLFGMYWSFIIGFIYDALIGAPLGITALAYLAADFFLRSQRSFFLHQSFVRFWIVVSVIILAVMFSQWGIANFITEKHLPLLPPILKAMLGILALPLLSSILHILQKTLPSKG